MERPHLHYREEVNRIVKDCALRYKNPVYFDAGSGTGVRAVDLADTMHASHLFLCDESPRMAKKCVNMHPNSKQVLCCSIDHLPQIVGLYQKFEVVTCLGNVLGHVEDPSRSLWALGKLLKPNGMLIVDAYNRYNIREYGWKAIQSIASDLMLPGVISAYSVLGAGNLKCPVRLTTRDEMDHHVHGARLYVSNRYYVDFRSGSRAGSEYEGQLVYVLRKNFFFR